MAVTKQVIIDVDVNGKELKNLNKELDNTQKEVKQTSEATNKMGDSLDNATGGAVTKFKGIKNAIKGVATGFKSLRVAIIASGIGALLIAVVKSAVVLTYFMHLKSANSYVVVCLLCIAFESHLYSL